MLAAPATVAMELSIVIPAYNEESRIARTLDRYLAAFPAAELVVVPNGCRDRTLELAETYRRRFLGRIQVKNIPDAVGKGAAVRAGFRLVRGRTVGFVDADGATDPAEFRKLVDATAAADGAIASRWADGAIVVNRSPVRRIVSRAFQLFVRLLFRLPYRDTQCGAKVFRREALSAVLPGLTVSNMTFDVELLLALRGHGFRIVEVPTVWVDQSRSAILGSPRKILMNSLRMLFTLVSLRFRSFRPSTL